MNKKFRLTLALIVPAVTLILLGIFTGAGQSSVDSFYAWSATCTVANLTWEGIPNDYLFHENTYPQISGQGSLECPWAGYPFPVIFSQQYNDPTNLGLLRREYILSFGISMLGNQPPGHSLNECSVFAAVPYYIYEYGQQVQHWRYLDTSTRYRCWVTKLPFINNIRGRPVRSVPQGAYPAPLSIPLGKPYP